MHAVVAVDGGEAEIGDDEPLRGDTAAVVALLDRGVGRQHVDAGLEARDRLGDGERRRHILVEARGHLHLAGIDPRAALLLERAQVVGGELALEVAALEHLGDAAVADAVDLDLDVVGVDRDERDALLAAVGQHVAAPHRPHRRRPVLHVDGQLRRFGQRLAADARRQPGADLHLVALAVGEPVDAQLARLGRHGLGVPAVDQHVLRPVHLARAQILAELHAQPRLGGVAVHLVLEDAEAVLGDQPFQRRLPLGRGGKAGAHAQCLDRRPPVGAALEGLMEHVERRRLGRRRARALVGVPGGTRGMDRQVVALAAPVRMDGEEGAGKAQPCVPIVGVGNHGLRERARGGAEVLASREQPVALVAQVSPRPGAGLPIRLQVGLVALGIGLHALVAEGELLRAELGCAEHDKSKAGKKPENGQHGCNP